MSKKRSGSRKQLQASVPAIQERRQISGIHELEVDEVELFTFELDREPSIDMQDDVEHLIYFDIKRGSVVKKRNLMFVDIAVGKQKDSDVGTKIFASYFFVVLTPEEGDVISDDQLRAVARISIWPLFCNNFRSIVSNTSLQFPDFPSSPPMISVGKLGQTVDADTEDAGTS